jgi:D-alanyl-D-alanine carboxypeptidase
MGYIALSARHKQSKRKLWWSLLSVAAVALLGVGGWWLLPGDEKQAASTLPPARTITPDTEPEEMKLPLVNLQPVVDKWLDKQAAEFGIVVYDPANQKIIASHNPDKKYFAASLYKLFVAYLALEDIQKGVQNPDEALTSGFSRKECVDKMIRESHSPCGEAMMAAMGQEKLRQRVSAMGIKNTVFAGITTTAKDSALILQYLWERRDLNTGNTTFLKDAMRVQEQRFRNGLAKGAPEATWETKVGWNLDINYHDVGIMTLRNGRSYIVAILSQNNGSPKPIADFAATIYQALQ